MHRDHRRLLWRTSSGTLTWASGTDRSPPMGWRALRMNIIFSITFVLFVRSPESSWTPLEDVIGDPYLGVWDSLGTLNWLLTFKEEILSWKAFGFFVRAPGSSWTPLEDVIGHPYLGVRDSSGTLTCVSETLVLCTYIVDHLRQQTSVVYATRVASRAWNGRNPLRRTSSATWSPGGPMTFAPPRIIRGAWSWSVVKISDLYDNPF